MPQKNVIIMNKHERSQKLTLATKNLSLCPHARVTSSEVPVNEIGVSLPLLMGSLKWLMALSTCLTRLRLHQLDWADDEWLSFFFFSSDFTDLDHPLRLCDISACLPNHSHGTFHSPQSHISARVFYSHLPGVSIRKHHLLQKVFSQCL